MKNVLISVLVLIAIVAIVSMSLFSVYNGLVSSDEAVTSAWSQVENQLQRRMDLIPNLVSTVKGYAAHEEKIFTEVTKSREKLMGAGTIEDKAEANQELTGSLPDFLQ